MANRKKNENLLIDENEMQGIKTPDVMKTAQEENRQLLVHLVKNPIVTPLQLKHFADEVF